MAAEITLYHNPRCSKSRATLARLEEAGAQVTVVEYLKTPPDGDTLAGILRALGMTAHELLRTKEAPYAELHLGEAGVAEETVLAALQSHPILMERPIAVRGERAVIGRPPENADTLLD